MTTLASLAERGFVFQAVVDIDDLPDWVTTPIVSADVDLRHFQRLIMLGQGGPRLWDSMEAEGFQSENRFDDYARAAVAELSEALGDPACEVIYPADVLLPLGKMAQRAGWGASSPLGLTINDTYGLWLAHRIVFLIDADLPTTSHSTTHACDTCATVDCVSACPAGAVSIETGFDVDACSRFRISENSPCVDRCLARMACPIGTEHRYGEAQMAHHYASGLASIRRWYLPED